MKGKHSSRINSRALARWQLRAGLAALAGALLLLAVPALAANLILAKDGHTTYRIVSVAQGAEFAEHAAAELATYLQRVTGAHFAVSSESSGGPVIKLDTDTSGKLARGGFRIRSVGQNIHITGGSPRGLLYGVYTFLEDYAGIHWYGPDEIELPRRPTLTLPPIDRTEAPAFAYREVFVREADKPEYSAHNRLNGRFGHRLVRAMGEYPEAFVPLRSLSIFELVSRKKYAKSHPEYYGGGQLRFADPGVRQAALETLRKKLEQWSRNGGEQPYYLLIEHADRDTYYRGGADGKLIKRYDSAGAAYVDFVKQLAEQVANDYPNVTLLPLAYQWSRKPPQGMKLPKNMGVMFSDIERDFARPLQAADNRDVLADLQEWGKLTDQVLLWTYITNFGGYLQPYPDLHALTEDVPFLARQPWIIGVFAQGAYNTTGGEFSVLRTWLLAHLLWNPQQDPQRLIQTFLQGYYGAAAPQIATYIRLLHNSIERTGSQLSDKTPPTAPYLTANLLQEADRLFQQAEQAVANDPARLRHVRSARTAVDYAILASQPTGEGSTWIHRDARLERLQASMELSGMRAYREGGGASPKRLMEALAVERHRASPPAVCQGKPAKDCRSIQELAFDLAGGAQVVPDPSASDGAAVTMSGHTRVWGIQLPLDRLLPNNGHWRVYVAARVVGDSDGASKVLQAGVYPGKQRNVTPDELSGNSYQLIELPGLWQRDEGRAIWVAPPGSKSLQAIYVDRIVAVRADSS